MRKRSFILSVFITLLLGCKSGNIAVVDDYYYKKYILSCIDKYKIHGSVEIINRANRVYVFYTNYNLIDIFFSHGDMGDFTVRCSDYEGLIYCGGVVNKQFEVYRIKYANSSEDIFRKSGFDVGAVNINTCGTAKQRRYILDGVNLEYTGEQIFDCRK